METAIKVENLSKAYRLGEIGTGTLSHDLNRWWAKVRGKEDPFLKIGEENDRTSAGKSSIVWSLKDINFEIKQGDTVGIIGRNGAGKSTLLKILSRVTAPTLGKIEGQGRIASLLEVGTGFHPELTGRENIYLNGTILGMRRKEITRKFDEIVHFAGVERYIDTPVKRYSSGMYVRLAFAVAAHLDSEILIVDEVLAVGDTEFQKKCIDKMSDVSNKEGRTILFVSHNMGSVLSLCKNAYLLEKGQVAKYGTAEHIIQYYFKRENIIYQSNANEVLKSRCGRFELKLPYWIDKNNSQTTVYKWGDDYRMRFEFFFNSEVRSINPGIALINSYGDRVFTSHLLDDKSFEWRKPLVGKVIIDTRLNLPSLAPGEYRALFGVRDENDEDAIFDDTKLIPLDIEYFDKPKNAAAGLLWHTTEWTFS